MDCNLHNTKFHKAKRSFLISVLGLVGLLPFMRLFKNLNKKPYFFLAHLHGGYVPGPINELYMKKDLLKKFNNKMLQQGKLIKFRYIHSPNKSSWLYVFNSHKGYEEWSSEVSRLRLFSPKRLPNHLRFSKTKGFLNPEDFALI